MVVIFGSLLSFIEVDRFPYQSSFNCSACVIYSNDDPPNH